MNLVALALVAISALNFSIAFYVLACNPKRAGNRFFAFFSVCVGSWTLAIVGSTYPDQPKLPMFYIAFCAASLIPVGLALTLEALRDPPSLHLRKQPLALLLVGLTFAVLSFSPYIVADVAKVNGEIRIVYGALHGSFCVYMVGAFGLAGRSLYQLYKASLNQKRLQIKYLSLGVLVSALVATLTNVFVPFAFGTSRASIYGPLASLLMLPMIAHAIVRHRLMDVRVVVKRGVVYLAASVVAGISLLLLLIGASVFVRDTHHIPVREIALALLVAALFHPLKGAIQRAFDRYLYREPYDYPREIRQTSRALSGTIDLPALLMHVGTTLDRTLRPEWYAFFLLDDEQEEFCRVSGVVGALEQFPIRSPLMDAARRGRKPIFRDELSSQAIAILADMSRLASEVVVPLVVEEQMIGFLALGPKRSGDPYFSDDEDLLSTLADQSSVAIRNAQTHQQVVEAHEYIHRILGTIESGVISITARGRVRLFNRAAEVMTGARAEVLRGQPVDHLPGPLARLMDGTLQDGQCRTQVELSLPDAAGQVVPLVCSTSPLLSPQGALVGAVAVVNDLSRLKELEQEKRRAERLAALESIASGLVHEIQNPLVAIKTFTQLLPSRAGEPGFPETVARISDREISRIEDLLRRFRTLAAPAVQPMEPVDVTQPLQATLELLAIQLDERRIRLRYVADGTPRPVLGNASQLEQLFLNICLNALEAMGPDGELTVRVADLCAAGGATLLVEVSDTGTGIAEELLPSIFNPFVTTKPRGSGLGLAICRSIADAHRATLSARNNTGRAGSTFTIEFPVPAGSAASVRP